MANKSKDKKFHFLYRTTNLLNKKVYYGIHSTNNLDDGYLGSGSYLYRSIKKYGRENFKREILEFFHNRVDLAQAEKDLVTEELVKDPMCYNSCTGGEGWNSINTIPIRDKEGRCYRVHNDDPRYLSGELVHIAKGRINVKDIDGNLFNVATDDPRYLSGELVHMFTGTIAVKDKIGNYYNVSINDPRYLSGELVHITKETITVRDEEGKCFRINGSDPRYLSGELVGSTKGYKHSKETRKKLSESLKGKQSGKRNSQHGTIWITNGEENKKIKKDIKIPNGWFKGRKLA